MSSIRTGIELNDQFSGVLNNIVNSVNLAVSAMYDMQQSMNADIDTSSIEGARDEINQATAAINAMNEALNNQTAPDVVPPVVDEGNQEPIFAPIEPVLPDPLVENPDPVPLPVQPNAPLEPVEVPVTWQTDGLEVFTGTGIERFQQEVQSANDMLNTLNQTQAQIAQTASGIDILPDEAIQDINALEQRLQTIQQRIQQIENNPVNIGTDTANAELEQLRSQLNMAVQEQNELNQAMRNMDVSAANDAYLHLSQAIRGAERYIRDNVDEQGRFNWEIQEGVQHANELTNMIKNAVTAYVGVQSIGKVLNISDELVQTTSRLNMMNDNLQSTEELVNMVYAAAQDARGSFSEMADVVARFGNNAKDAFSSSEEVVAFADLVQKQMTIAGASTQEASNAMLQLSQALGSGVLRGDELNSIFEQAPNLIRNIADYLDVPIGQIREMASEGELSADVVKAAIFAGADEINAKFEEMPMTWGQIWQKMQNTALIAFRPVLKRLNVIANSEAFQTFVSGVIDALATLANVVLEVFDFMASCGQFVADNWSVISPIIYGVIAALAVYGGYLAITKGIELASAAVKGVLAAAEFVHVAALAAQTGATISATAAQLGLNSAMYTCPIVWIIVLVIALIAALIALCDWIAKVTGAANSGIGIIVGVIMASGAFVKNLFITLYNTIIDTAVTTQNVIASFANFLGNVFTDPIGAIARLFFDLVDCILSLLQTLANAIDTVFGSNLSSSVQGWRDSLSGWVDETFGQGEEVMAKVSGESLYLERVEYTEAWNNGVALGDAIATEIDNFSLSDIFGSTDIPHPEDYSLQFAGMSDSLNDIGTDTSNIADTINITEEDLKYLRDIAERDIIDKYTLAEVHIEQNNTNTINSGDDIDGVMTKLTDAVNEAVDSITEGVHE